MADGAAGQAKWGEGDSRWIVEERSDGANVNGWHWSAVKINEEAKALLEALITETRPTTGYYLTALDEFNGDVTVETMKGDKCKVRYDLLLKFSWAGATSLGEGCSGGCVNASESSGHALFQVQ